MVTKVMTRMFTIHKSTTLTKSLEETVAKVLPTCAGQPKIRSLAGR